MKKTRANEPEITVDMLRLKVPQKISLELAVRIEERARAPAVLDAFVRLVILM